MSAANLSGRLGGGGQWGSESVSPGFCHGFKTRMNAVLEDLTATNMSCSLWCCLVYLYVWLLLCTMHLHQSKPPSSKAQMPIDKHRRQTWAGFANTVFYTFTFTKSGTCNLAHKTLGWHRQCTCAGTQVGLPCPIQAAHRHMISCRYSQTTTSNVMTTGHESPKLSMQNAKHEQEIGALVFAACAPFKVRPIEKGPQKMDTLRHAFVFLKFSLRPPK